MEKIKKNLSRRRNFNCASIQNDNWDEKMPNEISQIIKDEVLKQWDGIGRKA